MGWLWIFRGSWLVLFLTVFSLGRTGLLNWWVSDDRSGHASAHCFALMLGFGCWCVWFWLESLILAQDERWRR
ncbi:hypothetical protein, partial [Glycomyces tenuis]|uniref:hypothetical protein n=1 Tax=Glycomyces tenuis TaxID=58116 RepID=UPI001B7F8D0E